jgi:hypothetical protein
VTGFGRILADLNRAGVGYVLIGGIALIRHGVARAMRDIDAVLGPGEENLDRLRARRGGEAGDDVADLQPDPPMARPGLEPGTPRFSVVCSTN